MSIKRVDNIWQIPKLGDYQLDTTVKDETHNFLDQARKESDRLDWIQKNISVISEFQTGEGSSEFVYMYGQLCQESFKTLRLMADHFIDVEKFTTDGKTGHYIIAKDGRPSFGVEIDSYARYSYFSSQGLSVVSGPYSDFNECLSMIRKITETPNVITEDRHALEVLEGEGGKVPTDQ